MRPITSRRAFLRATGAGGIAALLGCRSDEPAAFDTGRLIDPGTGQAVCPDPFAGGTFLESLPFDDPGGPFGVKLKEGWDARLRFDLATLADGAAEVVPNDLFFVRTEEPDLLEVSPEDWQVRVRGLVGAEVDIPIAAVTARAVDQGPVLLECSGNQGNGFGLISTAQWEGAPLAALLRELADVDPAATQVLVRGCDAHSVPSENGHSTPGAAWVFSWEALDDAGAFLATAMNGVPLPADHGRPVRLVVPGWYGCACIKWVDEIVLVDDTAPPTDQMAEFASRVHQSGVPDLARDFRRASMELSAIAARVERWELDGEIAYRVVGILWGGAQTTDRLMFHANARKEPVACYTHDQNRTWTVWTHLWRPKKVDATYTLSLTVDEDLPQVRLDRGIYARDVYVPGDRRARMR